MGVGFQETQVRQSLVTPGPRSHKGTSGADTPGLRRLRFSFFKSQCQRAAGVAPAGTPMKAKATVGVKHKKAERRGNPEQILLACRRAARRHKSRKAMRVARATEALLGGSRGLCQGSLRGVVREARPLAHAAAGPRAARLAGPAMPACCRHPAGAAASATILPDCAATVPVKSRETIDRLTWLRLPEASTRGKRTTHNSIGPYG